MSTQLTNLGIVFPDTSVQTIADTTLGSGQTWQNLTSSRSAGVTYGNGTGRPIYVSIILTATGSSSTGHSVDLYVNGLNIGAQANQQVSLYLYLTSVQAVVPINGSYSITCSNTQVVAWLELS